MNRLLPDYDGGSIANLMRTLADACGAPPLAQAPLAAHFGLDSRTLARARNIVLLVVDGLGARRLSAFGNGALRQHAGKTLTSVFPSTTAAAIPTFMTGLVPAQHALTGWHMWFDELQAVAAVLPLTPRAGRPFATPVDALPGMLFDHTPIYPGLHRPAWVVSPQEIAYSPFNRFHTRGADTLAYADLGGLLHNVGALAQVPGKKFIYAYWPTLDSVSHHHGTDSRKAQATLQRFCAGFDALLDSLSGTDTWIIVTADHGFIDSPESRLVVLDDHPEIAAMLAHPLCGEQRLAWCHVKPGAEPDFERCVAARLGHCADLVPARRLLGEQWLGPGPAHPRLASRIGDYALVMRDNWSIKDWLPGEHRHTLLGVHGGVSADEMQVPLVALHA